ncbi:MAG: CapA family protein [Aeromicrobium sp.]
MTRRARLASMTGAALAVAVVCALLTDVGRRQGSATGSTTTPERRVLAPEDPAAAVRLAFAGDVHFEGALSNDPSDGTSTLGPMSDVLAEADLAMVNLESAVTRRGERTSKEWEAPANRYWFRTGPAALDLLDRSGVDVVSVANNHGADFGLTGVRDTIRAAEASDVSVVGIGRNDRAAFAPHRVSVRDTDIAVHAADASPRESADAIWAATPGSGPGIASARGTGTSALLAAVRESAATDDLVVVYLHWGEEGNASSTTAQESTAAMLEAAGADIVVGTHAHTPLGSGMRGSTYVSYGLGNFYWYHGREAETGVLSLTVQGDEVVGDEWGPARIPRDGGSPRPLSGVAATAAVQEWNELRTRTDLTAGPGPVERPAIEGVDDGESLPTFASTVSRPGLSVRRGIRSTSAESCPVPIADLRHVTVTYVGFDGQAHRGELVVHADVASDVVGVFATLYAERFPIQRMLLIDEYAGDDDRSMAANNTSAHNCRRVANSSSWSDHAYGRAVDINPVQNPYVVGDDVRPPAAAAFVDADRSAGSPAEPGVIRDGDVVRREFERIGWQWGGLFTDPDFQHFSSPAA